MLFLGATHNAGQVCFTMKRLFVHEKVYDAVKAELIAMAKEVKLGNPFDPDVTMGPVQNKALYDRLRYVYIGSLWQRGRTDVRRSAYTGVFSRTARRTGTRSRTRARSRQKARRATSSRSPSSTTLPTSAV